MMRLKARISPWMENIDFFKLTLLGPNSHRDDFAIAFSFDEARVRIDDFSI